MRNSLRIVIMIGVFVLAMFNVSLAVDYPTKPITLINPNPPGGGHDAIGRSFASIAEKHLGQPVVVVNKSGASGLIGMVSLVQAAPDGYTLGLDSTTTTNALEWEVANGRKTPFTRNDLIPIGCLTINVPLVVVPYKSPWKTLPDMVKDCKEKPDTYAFCSGGLYGGSHLPAEVLAMSAGIKVRHVPYKGGGPCLTALVGEHVHFATQWPASTIPLVRGNKLKVLAVQDDRRLSSLPDVPTVKELGIDAVWNQWLGISAPKKTPASIIEKLKGVIKHVTEDPSFIKIIEDQGGEVRYLSSDEVVKLCDAETNRLAIIYKRLIETKK